MSLLVSCTSKNIRLQMIVSGGQSGVDRAALDCSIAHGLPHGGWCPAGRLAEDGVISNVYLLRETTGSGYRERTLLNVQDSDGTLILAGLPLNGGTALTAEIAGTLNKPCLVIDPVDDRGIDAAISWLDIHAIEKLNIAGPRASKQPEIYHQAYRFIDSLLVKLFSGINTHKVS